MDSDVQPATPERRLEEQYLAVVCDLCTATEEAIRALAANSLPALREVTPRQEDLAARLQEMIKRSSSLRGTMNSSLLAREEDAFTRELVSMQRRLAALNRRYAALLRRVRRSVELSLAVCRSCAGSFDRNSEAPACCTWSCEV